jgi:hypothetical protein
LFFSLPIRSCMWHLRATSSPSRPRSTRCQTSPRCSSAVFPIDGALRIAPPSGHLGCAHHVCVGLPSIAASVTVAGPSRRRRDQLLRHHRWTDLLPPPPQVFVVDITWPFQLDLFFELTLVWLGSAPPSGADRMLLPARLGNFFWLDCG